MGLALLNRDALFDFPSFEHVRDIERDDIHTAQAGVDGEAKHRDVAQVAFLREEGADRRHLLRREGRFSSDDLTLVPGLFSLWHIA